MRIVFLPASLARLAPDRPAVFLVSGLAREILLALTGERGDGRAAGGYDRAALARLRRSRSMSCARHASIYHALVLLADGHDTSYVAHACGWANPSSFIAAFAGTTPGRYRTGDVPG
jgi:hypothetical protein